jgi:hypothetical protein
MDPAARSLADAEQTPYWLEDPVRPAARAALTGEEDCDLLVVGGGYTGLWTALLAKERDPDRDVVLVEGARVGWAASGRNGGFCAASLTHGAMNGLARWPGEFPTLQSLGERNLDAIEEAVARYGIDCDFERTGEIDVATEPYQYAELREAAAIAVENGVDVELLDRDQVRAEVDSRPAYGSTNAPPPPPSSGTAPAWPYVPPTAACWPTGSHSAPTPSPRSSAGSAPTPSRSTTTPWSPGRSPPTSAGRSAGAGDRASATAPTASTTSGSPPTSASCGAATTRYIPAAAE